MEKQNLLDAAHPVGELEGREVVDLVVPADERTHGSGPGTLPAKPHLGFPNQPDLADVGDRDRHQAVRLADDERIPVESDQPDVPHVALVVQRDLPAVVLGASGLADREQERERAAEHSEHGWPPGYASSSPLGAVPALATRIYTVPSASLLRGRPYSSSSSMPPAATAA